MTQKSDLQNRYTFFARDMPESSAKIGIIDAIRPF